MEYCSVIGLVYFGLIKLSESSSTRLMSFYFSDGTLSINNQRLISVTLQPAELWMTATVPLRPTTKSYWKDFINIHKILKSAWYRSEWDSSFFRHFCNYCLLSCLCVFLFVCLHGAARLSLDRFSWNFTFDYFLKICCKIQVWLKSAMSNVYFTWRCMCFYDNIWLDFS